MVMRWSVVLAAGTALSCGVVGSSSTPAPDAPIVVVEPDAAGQPQPPDAPGAADAGGTTLPTMLPVGPACDAELQCDRVTGCVAPAWPFPRYYELLPPGPVTDQYVADLDAFESCRATQLAGDAHARPRKSFVDGDFPYVSDKVAKWNGAIFWRPATASTDPITRAGDEARAVFGALPPADCTPANSKLLVQERDGHAIALVKDALGVYHWSYTDENNQPQTADELTTCDKPSLAEGVTVCGTSSRLGRTVSAATSTVSGVALCRKTRYMGELDASDFWDPASPRFDLLGYILFNSASGEVAFFDGVRGPYDWTKALPPPGGTGYADAAGRAQATQFYDATDTPCVACHDNLDPMTITPYIEQARVGNTADTRPLSIGDYLPQNIRTWDQPYRAVGSGFTARMRSVLETTKVFQDPPGLTLCGECHTLTTANTGAVFARDAVGRGDPTMDPAVHRSAWASAPMHIQPWMVDYPDGNALPSKDVVTNLEWPALSGCIDGTGAGCEYRQAYTTCPAPESTVNDQTRIGDPSGPVTLLFGVADNRDGDSADFKKEVHVTWTYLNSLGGVPTRDDVRFNLAVKELDIPADGSPPAASDYPTVAEAESTVVTGLYRYGNLIVLGDASFAGHLKNTDPAAATAPRTYRLDHPARCMKRYAYRLLAKRFCFDETGDRVNGQDSTVKFSANGGRTFYRDVSCVDPSISGIYAPCSFYGAQIVINGNGLGGSSARVTIDGRAATVAPTSTDGALVVTVPAGARSGTVTVDTGEKVLSTQLSIGAPGYHVVVTPPAAATCGFEFVSGEVTGAVGGYAIDDEPPPGQFQMNLLYGDSFVFRFPGSYAADGSFTTSLKIGSTTIDVAGSLQADCTGSGSIAMTGQDGSGQPCSDKGTFQLCSVPMYDASCKKVPQ